jgi:long-chain acyl-CoA synthetase
VFVSNHVTMVDHALILLALPGRFRRRLAIAMDAETLDKWRHPPPGTTVFVRGLYLLQYVLAMLFFGGFYLPQKSGFRRSFARAGDLMDRGYNILVFPEGQRTKHGRLHPFLAGTGLLIGQLDAAVVPLRIDGLWELKRARKYVAAAGTLSLAIGEPLRYSPLERPERIARDLEDIVGRL